MPAALVLASRRWHVGVVGIAGVFGQRFGADDPATARVLSLDAHVIMPWHRLLDSFRERASVWWR